MSDFITGYSSVAVGGRRLRTVVIESSESSRQPRYGADVQHRGRHRPQSDLDIGVRGCPPEHFYRLLGRLIDELSHPVTLVDLDTEIRVAEFLEQEGQLVHVG